tara:strand:+ start:541 stop:1596 length:1056 start_codon:yes stop_codon:yes gene_type:complete
MDIKRNSIISYSRYSIATINNKEIIKINITKPECQRALDNEQVNNILKFQLNHQEKYGDFFFSNPITLAEFENKIYIIDGQHRLTCIEKLNKINNDFEFDIPVTILRIESREELESKYIAINQNKPVPLPENINDWNNFTRHIEDYLTHNFSVYFSRSENPQSPNFNNTKLIRYFNDKKIGEQIGFNYELFINEIKELNNFYLQSYDVFLFMYFPNILKYIRKCKEKQNRSPFILGIFKRFEWVDRIVYKIQQNVQYEQMKHIPENNRVKIKKALRQCVWSKHLTPTGGNCFVCSVSLTSFNFECGHIKSVFYGGQTCLSNLVPICSGCNGDMGIKNLDVYKKELVESLNT